MSALIISALYVPGDRPERFAKAMAAGADAVVLDLEDAVLPTRKALARDAVVEQLTRRTPEGGPLVHVRINGWGTPWMEDDLAALRPVAPAGVRVPKVESPAQVLHVAAALGAQDRTLQCLIESARGLEAAYEIATAHPAVATIGLGEADLAGDLGTSDDAGLAWARSRVVVAARAAGLPSPLMSVHANVGDLDGLAESCRRGRAMGFLGRSAIHPTQVPVIREAFRPTAAELERARAVLDALAPGHDGVLVLADGRMVDAAMVGLARRTVELAERLG